jgi:hypothetical protein
VVKALTDDLHSSGCPSFRLILLAAGGVEDVRRIMAPGALGSGPVAQLVRAHA